MLRYDGGKASYYFFNLTYALASAAGGEVLEAMRRFEVAQVRRRTVGRALPRAYLQADLDIVSPHSASTTERALAEAEVIKVQCVTPQSCATRTGDACSRGGSG